MFNNSVMDNYLLIFVLLLLIIVISFYFIIKIYKKNKHNILNNDLLTNSGPIIQNALRYYNNDIEREYSNFNSLYSENITEDNKKILDFNNSYFNMFDRLNNTTDNFNNSIDIIKHFNFDDKNIKIKDIYNTIVN